MGYHVFLPEHYLPSPCCSTDFTRFFFLPFSRFTNSSWRHDPALQENPSPERSERQDCWGGEVLTFSFPLYNTVEFLSHDLHTVLNQKERELISCVDFVHTENERELMSVCWFQNVDFVRGWWKRAYACVVIECWFFTELVVESWGLCVDRMLILCWGGERELISVYWLNVDFILGLWMSCCVLNLMIECWFHIGVVKESWCLCVDRMLIWYWGSEREQLMSVCW